MQEQRDSKTWVALAAVIGSGTILVILAAFLVARASRGTAQQAEFDLAATAAELETLNAPVTPNFATAIPTPTREMTPTELGAAEEAAPAGEDTAPNTTDVVEGLPQPTTAPAAGADTGDYANLFYDQHDTTFEGTIGIGSSASGTIASSFDAHNYTFTGTAGQVVTIRVNGQGNMDPILTIWSPDYSRLSYNDDSGGGTHSTITVTLPTDGVYIARVRCWVTGTYTISAE